VVPVYRQWAAVAIGPYLATAAGSLVLSRSRATIRARCALAAVLFLTVAVVPLALELAWGPHALPVQHVQSETLVTEAAARALVHGRDPYASTFSGPLSAWPGGTRTHDPYLPLMLVFGLPRAASDTPAADARVAFLAAAIVAMWAAARVGSLPPERALLLFQALLVLPTGGLLLAGGGDDVVVAAVMVTALACWSADRPIGAGALAGGAAAMKALAWPLFVFVVVGSFRARGRGRGRGAVAAAVTAGLLVGPFVAWGPSSFYDDVIRFPLGYGKPKTFHPTPAPGVLLARAFPGQRGVVGAFAALAILAVLGWFLTRPGPWTSRRIATGTALCVMVGLLVAPAARLGFVVYPVAILAWGAIAPDEGRAAPAEGRGADPAGARPAEPAIR
jgi:hypothetical protein